METDATSHRASGDFERQGGRGNPDRLEALVAKLRDLNKSTVSFEAEQMLLEEGELNTFVYVILEGEVAMLKRGERGMVMEVDHFGPGDLLGLTSFWTQEPSFLASRALSRVRCLRIEAKDMEQLVHRDPGFGRTIHQLFISNLSNRYRRMIGLNVRVAELSEALKAEHKQLKAAMSELEETRNQLVHKEKLATLGQLLAGIAHEINNPCAALSHGVTRLREGLISAFTSGKNSVALKDEAQMLLAGLDAPYRSAEEKRARMEQVLQRYPRLKRSLARRLAHLDDAVFDRLGLTANGATGPRDVERIEAQIEFYEIGVYLRSVDLSSERIQKLVQSLKNYNKPDQEAWQDCDLSEGIRDTLVVLNNRLKHYDLVVDLDPVPPVRGIGSEINQVWTNLLVNATQATGAGGRIEIKMRASGKWVEVRIADSGTGIDPAYFEKIFELNFTTKKTKTDFGLGLGLSIAREIVEKHGGRIRAENSPSGGAVFVVQLPLD
ncbi:MAG: sensor histidine kinase [Opitutales bacterium]